ncbi:hypothetical protein SAMN04488109_0767 [Chryseolinea serpens]|uniref:Uncharacterized protein n=1 Tax=Chryseolinea serpens TaxID=947013 RepID=A0A1M5KQC9_9BACT|nr:hypothetical protein [Chryseolinea serpens]SHG54719.1 hypothetical protein SAMN04488109_0767 [Chryseolinea serpens]
MNKLLTLIILVAISCLLAGLYGILHDQLTYTISPEYYTKFKFYQFGLMDLGSEAIFPNPRIEVAAVGLRATWWMGIPIGAVLGLVGLIHRDWRTMLKVTLKAFLITVLIAFATGLIGLAYGHIYLASKPRAEFANWYLPDNLVDFASFIQVGSMHNFSYLGGLNGLIGGLVYTIVQWRTETNKNRREDNKDLCNSRPVNILIMRLTNVIIMFVTMGSQQCYAQRSYDSILSVRLAEIKGQQAFDNGIVLYDEDSGYGSTFPLWDEAMAFYQDDMVVFKGRTYRALQDSKGKRPSTSPQLWQLDKEPMPYLFLRDTARIEDLRSLLKSNHPYIRTYALGALAYRKAGGLFQVVVDNLKDTTRMMQMTSDFGYEVCPADLMLEYTIKEFNNAQKDTLKKLILTKYTHLNVLEEILIFHKPVLEDYSLIKSMVRNGLKDKFGLIALSAYCKPEDIEFIRTGFELDRFNVHYGGYKVFFKAIENFPDKAFKQDLIACASREMQGDIWIDEYYVRALASYKDQECLAVLKELSKKENGVRMENLATIYRSLRRHYSPLYDSLIKEIKNEIAEKDLLESRLNYIEESPWNYE